MRYARRKKVKLFVTFVDFRQAFDSVPRHKLFQVLQRLGCGMMILSPLIVIYAHTESLLGTATILMTVGVRQGSPTSCLLFVVFVDDLIRMIRARCGMDGFLLWLHAPVLMDDTMLLATTKCNMVRKIALLQDYCHEYGMRINQGKTKFFVIGGKEGDSEALVVNELVVEHCQMYFLSSVFTTDGSVSSAVIAHANAKMSHALKFVSFINKNNSVPFVVKKRVVDAALMSSLLYVVSLGLEPMLSL